jgi:parallel beta-helix repeat protein
MFFSQGNEIIGNTIDSTPCQGINLCDCRYNNIIKFNNISSTEKGIQISIYSSQNIFESNNLINNTYGIYLSGTDLLGFVPNNVISKNNIIENEYGIYITISSFYGYSNDSLIYHNNFINNSQNAYDICSNMWNDSSSGGNFWDDYNGTDADGDCRGDTPYNISGKDNQDCYPLMLPYNEEPPLAEITKPVRAALYLFNIKIGSWSFLRNPLIFGSIDIEVNANDSISGIECVKFYIDDKLISIDANAPYSCRWGSGSFIKHRHNIKIVAVDNFGNNASDEIQVWKFL